MKAIHRKRLLNVAKALRESPEPDKFSMLRFVHACGTPACALGHYAARRDLQREYTIALHPTLPEPSNNLACDSNGGDICETQKTHFGLTEAEADELFEANGCGNAQTAKQAARYIERFVARKDREAKP